MSSTPLQHLRSLGRSYSRNQYGLVWLYTEGSKVTLHVLACISKYTHPMKFCKSTLCSSKCEDCYNVWFPEFYCSSSRPICLVHSKYEWRHWSLALSTSLVHSRWYNLLTYLGPLQDLINCHFRHYCSTEMVKVLVEELAARAYAVNIKGYTAIGDNSSSLAPWRAMSEISWYGTVPINVYICTCVYVRTCGVFLGCELMSFLRHSYHCIIHTCVHTCKSVCCEVPVAKGTS